MNSRKVLGLSALLVGTSVGSALAQSGVQANQDVSTPAQNAAPVASSSMSPDNAGSYATGKPLEGQSKEGFWGHMNPFARKKWVHRQLDPIQDRTNELDQLQSKNANDIRDVDSRSQAGVNKAMIAAKSADGHAQDAASRANAANTLAGNASDRTNALNGTVSNLDQYQQVAATPVKFATGRTTLGPQGKAELDQMAAKLASEKGYIIEVQGYSRSGIQTSQAMADSVVRYLVIEHQVPIYRIYRTGLGKNTASAADGEKPLINGVQVTLLHNSLATMSSNAGPSTATNGTSNPSTAAATTSMPQ